MWWWHDPVNVNFLTGLTELGDCLLSQLKRFRRAFEIFQAYGNYSQTILKLPSQNSKRSFWLTRCFPSSVPVATCSLGVNLTWQPQASAAGFSRYWGLSNTINREKVQPTVFPIPGASKQRGRNWPTRQLSELYANSTGNLFHRGIIFSQSSLPSPLFSKLFCALHYRGIKSHFAPIRGTM